MRRGRYDGARNTESEGSVMEKLIRGGNVAVLISPGFGTGWSSSCSSEIAEALLFERRIVEAFEEGGWQSAVVKVKEMWPDEYVCVLGAECLQIEWIPQGEQFYLHEYDGNEWIVRSDGFHTA